MSDETRTSVLPFSQFYDNVIAWAAKNKERRITDSIKKTMATEERILELSEKVTRGRLTKEFLAGEFWKNWASPFLRSEAVLKPAVLKDGDAPTKRAYTEYLIGSGRVLLLTKFIAILDSWQEAGEEAAKILALEAEKRKRLAEL